ncbi:hypothetical protein TWF694_003467 [Orbilia ellipsospora]|uniref:Uncharacterized protein n=1 Tax=Orbilia ellipsospora TaxID=2528407 RepID=A0AAV9X481_9PEZI
MQFSIVAVATLILAPLAAMAAPAPEAVPNVMELPDSDLHALIKRQSCNGNSCKAPKKCNCQ